VTAGTLVSTGEGFSTSFTFYSHSRLYTVGARTGAPTMSGLTFNYASTDCSGAPLVQTQYSRQTAIASPVDGDTGLYEQVGDFSSRTSESTWDVGAPGSCGTRSNVRTFIELQPIPAQDLPPAPLAGPLRVVPAG
jgi:hypothetical protein